MTTVFNQTERLIEEVLPVVHQRANVERERRADPVLDRDRGAEVGPVTRRCSTPDRADRPPRHGTRADRTGRARARRRLWVRGHVGDARPPVGPSGAVLGADILAADARARRNSGPPTSRTSASCSPTRRRIASSRRRSTSCSRALASCSSPILPPRSRTCARLSVRRPRGLRLLASGTEERMARSTDDGGSPAHHVSGAPGARRAGALLARGS